MNLNFLSLTLVICEIDFRQIDAIFDFDSLENHNFMIFGSLFPVLSKGDLKNFRLMFKD